MIRYLTVDERKPQPGDVIRRGDRRLKVISWGYYDKTLLIGHVVEYEIADESTHRLLGETYSIGPCPEGGWHCSVSPPRSKGWHWWPPYRYESRADGGEITHPIDAGAWV